MKQKGLKKKVHIKPYYVFTAEKNRASQRLLIINTLTTTLVLLILALEATEGRPQQQQPQKVGPQKQHQLRRNIDNCWALVDETYWPRIINFDQATSTIRIFIQQTGPRVLRCLQGKIYFLIVM